VFQLSKYPALNNFEKQTSVPKVYMILGLAGLYFFLIFFNIAGEFLVNIAGFIIPGYYSLEALFSASKVDDTQWLTVRIPHFLISGKKLSPIGITPNFMAMLTRQ
jgi:receptor expression-enhancing protein 5/6